MWILHSFCENLKNQETETKKYENEKEKKNKSFQVNKQNKVKLIVK